MKKILTTGFIFLTSINSYAGNLICSAQLPRTACGSGEVEVRIDRSSKQYHMNLGAVICWGFDIQIEGSAIEHSNGSYPFFEAQKIDLLMKEFGELPKKIATMYVNHLRISDDVENAAAILDIEGDFRDSHILYRKQFNLTCTVE